MTTKTYRIEAQASDAPRLLDWIANRGGIARWQSIDLRDPSNYGLTPALTTTGKPTTKPGWKYSNTPDIITDPTQVGIYEEALFKAIPVSLKQSGSSLIITDASQRKVERLIEQCEEEHGTSHIKKGVLPDKLASIGVFYITNIKDLS